MIMEELGPEGVLCCFDQDPDARANVWEDTRLKFYPHNFRNIQSYLRIDGIEKVDGILADLGVSSHQFDTAERGFSFLRIENLQYKWWLKIQEIGQKGGF